MHRLERFWARAADLGAAPSLTSRVDFRLPLSGVMNLSAVMKKSG
jgi:hypothetical protein